MRKLKLGLLALALVGFWSAVFVGAGAFDNPDSSVASQPLQPRPRQVADTLQAPSAQAPAAPRAWQPAPRAATVLNASTPLVEPVLIGDCTGPASPGEFVAVSPSFTYDSDGPMQLVASVSAIPSNGRVPTRGTSRWWVVDGAGKASWTDRLRIPESPGTLRLAVDTGSIDGRSTESAEASVKLGATLTISVVDEAGVPVENPAIVVDSAGCAREAGAYIPTESGKLAAFYHIDPARGATLKVSHPGFFEQEIKLTRGSGELEAGRTGAVEVVLKSLVNMEALGQSFQASIDSMLGYNAVAVTDLQSGRTISVNGMRRQYAGCTIKIVLMMAVAQDIEAGKYTEADVAELVQRAMGPSQVYPAHVLFEMIGDGKAGVGVRRVNQIMWDLGATHSMITHPPGYYWEEYGYLESDGFTENVVTAEDFNTILLKLWKGEALSPWATKYVLWSMQLATGFLNGALGNPLPADVTLYHKMGQLDTWDGTWNDVGIVMFNGADGKQYGYVISYLGSLSRWRDHYGYGQVLSGAAWQAISAAYGY